MIRLAAAAAMVGVITGLATATLLFGLTFVTATREMYPWITWGLAPAGALTAWLYRRAGRDVGRGNSLIIDEIHSPRRAVPLRLAPLILFTTTLTHLVGGSAGREGSAVQMGGALAERVAGWFGLIGRNRRLLLAGGLAAGFAAAIDAPLGGAIFGLEVLGRGRWRRHAAPFTLLAAGLAVLAARFAPHAQYPPVAVDLTDPASWLGALAAGSAFGLVTRAFVGVTHALERWLARVPALPRATLGGFALSLIFIFGDLGLYSGLGLNVIASALGGPVTPAVPFVKLALTALTLAVGFKGGEFVPLVFIGVSLGAVLNTLGLEGPLAALGFGATFGAAANTPLACAVMTAEVLGWRLAPLALLTGYVAFAVSGRPGIYPTQPPSSLLRLAASRFRGSARRRRFE